MHWGNLKPLLTPIDTSIFFLVAEGGVMLHWVLAAVCGISLVVAFRLNCAEACGILVPWPGIKPASPALEARFLTTGPPGKFSALLYERKERGIFWSVDPMGQQTKVGMSTSSGMLSHYCHHLGPGSVVSISGRGSDQVRTKAMLTPTCSRCSPKFSKSWNWNKVSVFFFFCTHWNISAPRIQKWDQQWGVLLPTWFCGSG